MSTLLVKIDEELHSRVWQRSWTSPHVRVRVLSERQADEKGDLDIVASSQNRDGY
jgi:ribosomal protein L31E